MINVLLFAALTLVALTATAVVASPAPDRQAVTLSALGLLLGVLFLLLQAPDVALSQIAVGTAVVPLMIMLAVRTTDRVRGRAQRPPRP